jgi:hypothetical protein
MVAQHFWSAAAELAELPPWLGTRGHTKGGSSASSAAALQAASQGGAYVVTLIVAM